jgi:hypothetical protein
MMSTRKNAYWLDPSDPSSIDPLVEAVNARNDPVEAYIRAAACLQPRPFDVFIDYLTRTSAQSPFYDQFTFDMESDELIVYSDEPSVLIDALIEMAMYMQGFATLMGVEDTWKVQIAIGSWRHIRKALKKTLAIPDTGQSWTVMVNPADAERLDGTAFMELVTLAGNPEIEVMFPPNAAAGMESTYNHLVGIMDFLSQSITLENAVEFNQRLLRALDLIEDKLVPNVDKDDD